MLMCRFTLATQKQMWNMTPQTRSLVAIASDHDRFLDFMKLSEYKNSKSNNNYSRLREPKVPVNGYVSRNEIIIGFNKQKIRES